jgi:hypothetical protein
MPPESGLARSTAWQSIDGGHQALGAVTTSETSDGLVIVCPCSVLAYSASQTSDRPRSELWPSVYAGEPHASAPGAWRVLTSFVVVHVLLAVSCRSRANHTTMVVYDDDDVPACAAAKRI